MAKLTIKLPDSLKDQAEEVAEARGYQNKSEYIRAAIRDKIEEDLVVIRMQDDESDYISIEEAKERFTEDASTSQRTSKA